MTETTDPVLLADVGGTHVRFALADTARAQPLRDDSIRAYDVADFKTFTDSARAYLKETKARVKRGVFAIAGPVGDDVVRMTNSPWTVSRTDVSAALGLETLRFINDFAAMSWCITLLTGKDMRVLGAVPASRVDRSKKQTFAVLGPGTGLGVGALIVRDGKVCALETEGGHTGFAPCTDREIKVLGRLAVRFGRVSNERILSGSGLSNLHRALAEVDGRSAEELAPEEITRRAAAGEDRASERTVECFCELLGGFAGDFALAFGAWDGVYLAGGLVPAVLPWLQRDGFRRRFEDKGRYADKIAGVPTLAIVHPYAGLIGAAAFAASDFNP